MTLLPTILVPQGAEYQAICRGLRRTPHRLPVALPVGPEPVKKFLTQWCQTQQPPSPPVLVMGLCGSLKPDLGVGAPVLYQACLEDSQTVDFSQLPCDVALTETLATWLGSAVNLVTAVTCDRIIHLATDKQALAATQNADVVDMEGFAALNVLQQYKIPVAMLRVVSDDVYHDLPDLSAAVSSEGKLQALPMALGMLKQPVGAMRLIRGSLKGLQVLEQLTRSLAKAAATSEP